MSEAVRVATRRLERAGCETPRLDAEVLLACALGVDRAALVTRARDELPRLAATGFDAFVALREARQPVAYITGRKHFRRLCLQVDRRVLIPRPETELLVEVGVGLPPSARVADVGTGSGAVALALKDERPDLRLVGIDVSDEALAVARENAALLGLDVTFVRSDLLSEVPGPLDAVLANLPYVADGDPRLAAEITRYEPAEALFAGADGLDLIRRLVGQLEGVALAALEIGEGQGPAVEALLRDAGYAHVERLRDLAGHERVLVGRR